MTLELASLITGLVVGIGIGLMVGTFIADRQWLKILKDRRDKR